MVHDDDAEEEEEDGSFFCPKELQTNASNTYFSLVLTNELQ